ncbi:MAG: DUF262 domain-containing protein [Muribaculaceae bacterium]|nr:DUF262 domain-containing protein [Muribaculaceae bacterium]
MAGYHTLRELVEFSKDVRLRVPYYQRGYIWGKKREKDEIKDSVHYLMKDVVRVINGDKIFIQGITTTLTESQDGQPIEYVDIIDGQQRITTICLLLKTLGYNDLKLSYESRLDSDRYLNADELDFEFNENDSQDIHYFKNAARICQKEYSNELREHVDLLLDNIQFLWIKIPEDKAQDTFTMMNGQRAKMTVPELIKAELLRRASHDGQNGTSEWECQELRGRYARAWDNWLRWWKDDDITRKWLHLPIKEPLSFLILMVYNYMCMSSKISITDELSFEKFRVNVFGDFDDSKKAKEVFYQMRGIQKRFEDAFNNAITYNLIGGITYMYRNDRKSLENFLSDYFSEAGIQLDNANCFKHSESYIQEKDKQLEVVYKKSFLGLTYNEIKDSLSEENEKQFDEKLNSTKNSLFGKSDLYNDPNWAKEKGFCYLIRRNIDEDCKQNGKEGRKFDFTILAERSLEHIYPKSKVWHEDGRQIKDGNDNPLSKEDVMKDNIVVEEKIESENRIIQICSRERMLCRDSIGRFNYGADEEVALSEHSLGNLVLLYLSNNSEFSNSDHKNKKRMLFDPNCKELFRSRNLLHTIMVFARNEGWGPSQIVSNHKEYYDEFNKYYELAE